MTRTFARLCFVLAVPVGLAACGNKGPLVLPDQDKTKQAKQAEKAKTAEPKDAAKPAEPHR